MQLAGYLFRAAPTLILRDPTTGIMDTVFLLEGDSALKLRLLQLLQEFLLSQALKNAEMDRGKLNSEARVGPA